jgi:hypothetical protein
MEGQAGKAEEVYIVLSSYERALVKSIQSRKPGATPINWKALAEDVKMSFTYLQALCTMPLPEKSNEVAMSRVEGNVAGFIWIRPLRLKDEGIGGRRRAVGRW